MTIFITLYLFYPMLTQVSFNVFGCTEIEGKKYVTLDTDIECYGKTHVLWICLLSVPFIVIYVFGIPVF